MLAVLIGGKWNSKYRRIRKNDTETNQKRDQSEALSKSGTHVENDRQGDERDSGSVNEISTDGKKNVLPKLRALLTTNVIWLF